MVLAAGNDKGIFLLSPDSGAKEVIKSKLVINLLFKKAVNVKVNGFPVKAQ